MVSSLLVYASSNSWCFTEVQYKECNIQHSMSTFEMTTQLLSRWPRQHWTFLQCFYLSCFYFLTELLSTYCSHMISQQIVYDDPELVTDLNLFWYSVLICREIGNWSAIRMDTFQKKFSYSCFLFVLQRKLWRILKFSSQIVLVELNNTNQKI